MNWCPEISANDSKVVLQILQKIGAHKRRDAKNHDSFFHVTILTGIVILKIRKPSPIRGKVSGCVISLVVSEQS